MNEVDRKIIAKLQEDGRMTLKDIAEALGYTSMGIKKRVDKLRKTDVINVSAQLNVKKLDLCAALIMIEIEDATAMRTLLERFKECPRVVAIFNTMGGYNLIALVVADNLETLESISVEKCSLRSAKGIRRSEFYPIGDIYYQPFLPVREHLTHQDKDITPCNVDCTSCPRYEAKKCPGCPATKHYRGPL